MLDITAVVAVYNKWELTKAFLDHLSSDFPTVPAVISCLGSSREFQEKLQAEYGSNAQFTVVTGSIDKRVSFSENWNAATNAVQTSKMVLVHNDMYLHPDFFKNLLEAFSSTSDFVLYTTVEPYNDIAANYATRPGKVLLGSCGQDWNDFRKEVFLRFCSKYLANHKEVLGGKGYGFYLAGKTVNFRKVGGFDSIRFRPAFCEDDDLNIRIKLNGFKVFLCPRALAYHFVSKTSRDGDLRKTMEPSEIESNRNFARKWGLEARFLWKTGYENVDNISIGPETILYRTSGDVPESMQIQNILNVEPLVDFVQVKDLEPFRAYIEKFHLEHKFVTSSPENVDIVLEQTGPFVFNTFAELVGDLRWGHLQLKPGLTLRVDPFRVSVLNVLPDSRQDSENYLLLQKLQKYE